MTHDIAKNKDKEMIAIQIQKPGKSGRDYILPEESDMEQYRASLQQYLDRNSNEIMKTVPPERILANYRKKNSLWMYGIETWNEFFSSRQLLLLSTLVGKINSFCESSDNPRIHDLRIYLSFLVACLVNTYSYGVYWDTSRDNIGSTLTMRQPRIVFNLAEINPFEKVRGSLRNNVGNIVKAIEFCAYLQTSASCRMESVTTPSDKQYDIIITDPPYGDDVQYGELSEFLYLWVYRVLNDPTLPSRVPLDEDFCESQGRFGDKTIASKFFAAGLKKSFVSMNGKLKDDGMLVVFFAHSSVKAWNQLLDSIREGRFRVVASYAIHTESTANPLAAGKTSFMSSIVIVCRKITGESEEYIQDIIPRTEDDIKKMIKGIPNDKLLTLPFTDLLIMMYGRVLEACTRHTKLKSRSDEEYGFDRLLENSRSFIMRELMAKLTGQNMNIVGPRMAFYLLIKIFHDGKVAADDALKISQTYGTDLQDLKKDHVTAKISKGRRLCWLYETEMNYPPENVDMHNLHQQLCYIVYMAYCNKTDQVLKTISGSNFREGNLKQIISLILKSFNMRRNKNQDLSPEENTEITLLETLADILQIKMEGRMESFFT